MNDGFERLPFRLQSPRLECALSGALHDACIPFPRTSAVAFNIVGLLCTFSQTLRTKRLTLRHQNRTPRTLSSINGGGLLGNVIGPQPVLYTHRNSNSTCIHDRMISSKHMKSRNSSSKPNPPNAFVIIYECHRLLHINRDMVKELSVDQRNIRLTCANNRRVCAQNGRLDLIPIWTLAEMIATPNVCMPNIGHGYLKSDCHHLIHSSDPYRTVLLEELIMHFARNGDLQTAVVLSCLFHKPNDQPAFKEDPDINGSNPIMSVENIYKPTNLSFFLSFPTNSLSAMKTVFQPPVIGGEISSNAIITTITPPVSKSQCLLLSPDKIPIYDHFKEVYADILYGWQLLITRTTVTFNIFIFVFYLLFISSFCFSRY